MNNKKPVLIMAALLILFVLVFTVWNLTNRKTEQNPVANKQQEPQTAQKTEATDTTNSVTGNIYDLIKLGKTLKCEYRVDQDETKISGISYISGNNMRGDFESTDSTGNKIQSHMISDGEWAYTWSSAIKQGIKMNLGEAESENPATDEKNQNHDVFKDKADYKCSPWIEDTSLFQLPSDITFTDFSAAIRNIDPQNKDSMCAACEYAEIEADIAACKARLGCL